MVFSVIAYVLLAVLLAAAAVTDLRTGKVFNWLTYPAVLVGLAYWAAAGLLGAERDIIDALIGFAAGLFGYAAIIWLGGLGLGDMKLMAGVGALSAMWEVVLATTVYALLIGGVMAVVIMIRQGVVRQTLSRILGLALLKAARAKADPRPKAEQLTVPFAVAAALGGLLAGAEQMLGLVTPWAWLGP